MADKRKVHPRGKFRVTTISGHRHGVAPNVVHREFRPEPFMPAAFVSRWISSRRSVASIGYLLEATGECYNSCYSAPLR